MPGTVASLAAAPGTYFRFRNRYRNRESSTAILLTALIGVLDECIQAFLPGRVFDPQDILFNVLAAVMAVSASATLGWARRRRA